MPGTAGAAGILLPQSSSRAGDKNEGFGVRSVPCTQDPLKAVEVTGGALGGFQLVPQ